MRIRFGTMSACRLLARRTLLDIPGFHRHADIVPGISVARWSSGTADSKPKLLYVPGLESSGLNLYAHAEHLSHTFDLHSVVVDTLYKKISTCCAVRFLGTSSTQIHPISLSASLSGPRLPFPFIRI